VSREQVLTLLRAEGGVFLSGEQLSERLGLSRTAVWKAVKTLRQEGYEIEARTGMGYRLVAAPNVLTEAEIRSWLKTDRDLRCFDTIDSTNTYARQIALEGAADGTAAPGSRPARASLAQAAGVPSLSTASRSLTPLATVS